MKKQRMTLKRLRMLFDTAGRIELNDWNVTDWDFDDVEKRLRVASEGFSHEVRFDALKKARVDATFTLCLEDANEPENEVTLQFYRPERRMRL